MSGFPSSLVEVPQVNCKFFIYTAVLESEGDLAGAGGGAV